MIRLTEIKLPLQHQDEQAELRAAILAKLGISDSDLNHFSVFKRGIDARKKSDIQLIYTLDLDVAGEAALLKRFQKDPHVSVAPDTRYKYVASIPAAAAERPVVVGFGPCGLFAALILADEPTGNLDAATADIVFRQLLALVRETGMAALIATHNPDLAERMDRTVTLKDGLLSS